METLIFFIKKYIFLDIYKKNKLCYFEKNGKCKVRANYAEN